MICDDTGPISLAAVMGGETSEVVAGGTTNVLFEAAHWDPAMVGRTARRHKLFSEAAKRWERGVDPAAAAGRAGACGARCSPTHGGGTPSAEILDIDHVRPRRRISLAGRPARPADRRRRTRRRGWSRCWSGSAARSRRARPAVRGPGRGRRGQRRGTCQRHPPTWRPDLTDPADLVEEVVRLDGYDTVPSVLPTAPPGRGLTPRAAPPPDGRPDRWPSAGTSRCSSYPFVSPELADQLGLPADDPRRAAVRLANPLSEEEPLLRTTLLGPLLGILKRNLGRGHRDLALYEIGRGLPSASRRGGAAGDGRGPAARPTRSSPPPTRSCRRQPWHVAAVLTGDMDPAGWWGAGRAAGWADAIEAARDVLAAAGIPDRAGRGARRRATRPGTPAGAPSCAVDGAVVGHAGELHPTVVAALELPRRTCAHGAGPRRAAGRPGDARAGGLRRSRRR